MKLSIPTAVLFLMCACAVVDGFHTISTCVNRTLSSNRYGYRNRYLRTVINGARRITSMSVVRKYSRSACTFKRSFGFLGGDAWVHRGCRALFRICFIRGVSKTLTCSSNRFKYTECPAGVARVWTAHPVTHRSRSPCIPNFSYGMKADKVWVDKGCRATFHITG